MNKNLSVKYFKKPLVAVATFAVCFCFISMAALASTGKLQGFFKDVTNWSGAITGTTYEQSTEEVELSVLDDSG